MIGTWSLAMAALAAGTTPAPQGELGNTCSNEIVGEGNTERCTWYDLYPVTETQQDKCVAQHRERGFGEVSRCLCYLPMTQCTGNSSNRCSNAETYCRATMEKAGCNPDWCGTAPVGGDRDVSLTYTIGNGDAADVARRIKSYAMLMMPHNALEETWVNVVVAEGSPRTATVTVSIPASARYPEEVDAYVVTQLQDLPRSATFTANTFVLGVVDGSASLLGATPNPSWTSLPTTVVPATVVPVPSTPMPTLTPSIRTPAPTTPPAGEDSSDSGLIVGLVVGGIVLVVGGALALYCMRRAPAHAHEVEMYPTPHNASPQHGAPTFAGSPPLPVRGPDHHRGTDVVA